MRIAFALVHATMQFLRSRVMNHGQSKRVKWRFTQCLTGSNRFVLLPLRQQRADDQGVALALL